LPEFRPDEAHARELDADDALASYRHRFHIPRRGDGSETIYFCGNSLGAQPRGVYRVVEQELASWARRGVEGHFHGPTPWFSYHAGFRESNGRLVGARPEETVMMNGLTVNLHLLMVSFYRPRGRRTKILMEDCAFPSDTYAAQSQIRFHGMDPADELIIAKPRDGEAAVRSEDLERLLDRRGEEIALVLLGGVNYYSGQVFDMGGIAAKARSLGCVVGYDLAHAVGNVELALHDWNVDFAVWCTYKYLNGGPGATAGCFVHERHGAADDLPRFSGWWGHDPERRFRLHLEASFVPAGGADGWQLSNPSILALAPLRASLDLFDEVGIASLRSKSRRLTGYLRQWIGHIGDPRIEILTPVEPEACGCQLSLMVRGRGRELYRVLTDEGVVCDYREPDVVRVAPVPFYNSFHEVWRFGQVLARWSARA
jgi:kynureninase